jgi:hypothetical protein
MYRNTEEVFRQYDHQARDCLCCNALFDTLRDVADKYGLNLQELLDDLCAAGQNKE